MRWRAFASAWRCFAAGLAAALVAGAAGGTYPTQESLWFDDAQPGVQAWQAVALLADAQADGLDPGDYDAPALQRALEGLVAGALATPMQRESLEIGLTLAMQRYLADLHGGRVDPRQIHAHFEVPRASDFDPASTLRAALAAQRLPQAAREAAPRLLQYGRLRQVLAQYRALDEHPAWRETLPPPPRRKLEPGGAYRGVPLLVRRLQALGDLPLDAPLPAHYDGVLVEAVQSFQRRHGLASDGVIGQATLAALDVTPAQRVQQIALTLERLRWTPLLQAPRMIVVNVPEFVLRAYETDGDRVDVKAEMKVIVGRAMDTRTPLFDEDMHSIEFSPYWNVPSSIARAEVVPRLKRDPAYYAGQGFEFVARDGRVSSVLDAAQLEAVLRGELRVRQRPGPANALGDIKFVFPNNDGIYLHHTPALQLFERDRRDFSHGCIRVQDPVALARFVLQGQPEWTEARIREAMSQGTSRTLRLSQSLPVLIAYATALVKNGRAHFFPDLYGHDRLLDQALSRRPPWSAGVWP